MTLAESKKVKKMVVKGAFSGIVDLTDLWFKLYVFGKVHLSGHHGNYAIEYCGEWDKGLFVLGIVTETVRQAKADCHLEVNCVYEDD